MHQPLGYVDLNRPTYVYKLQRALYGLKRGPQAWFDRLNDFLLQLSFYSSPTNPTSIFFLSIILHKVFLFSYSTLTTWWSQVTTPLKLSGQNIFLTQHRYGLNLLSHFDMAICKPIATPCPLKVVISLLLLSHSLLPQSIKAF